jgi:hypothetical protein
MSPGRNKIPVKVGGGLFKEPGGVGPLGEVVHVPVHPLLVVLTVEELKSRHKMNLNCITV